MDLSFKDTKFIIEALDHLLTAYNKRLSEIEDLEEYEDEASELGNDLLFLESLRQELEKTLNENKTYSLLTPYNIHRPKEKAADEDRLVKSVLQLSINERLLLVEAISESIRHDNSLKASTARRKSKVKSQKSKVLWNEVFRDFKWLPYFRRVVLVKN